MAEVTLAIDTSTRVAVGLARDEKALDSRLLGDARSHVELLTPGIADMLRHAGLSLADLTRIVVGVGPGPFTGLRVGIATATTLATALDLPVTGVCSLDVIALGHAAREPFLAVLDARRREVYWARYDATGLRVDGPHVGPLESLPPLPAVGPGVPSEPGTEPVTLDAGLMAAAMAAPRLQAVGLEPLYLRAPDAELPSTRKSTIAGGRLRLPLAAPSAPPEVRV